MTFFWNIFKVDKDFHCVKIWHFSSHLNLVIMLIPQKMVSQSTELGLLFDQGFKIISNPGRRQKTIFRIFKRNSVNPSRHAETIGSSHVIFEFFATLHLEFLHFSPVLKVAIRSEIFGEWFFTDNSLKSCFWSKKASIERKSSKFSV